MIKITQTIVLIVGRDSKEIINPKNLYIIIYRFVNKCLVSTTNSLPTSAYQSNKNIGYANTNVI